MANDAMDVKEALSSHVIKAPVPPTGATKEERLREAQAHIAADAAAQAATAVPGGTTHTFKDPQFGHMVEETRLPLQAAGLDPAHVTAARRGQTLLEKDDPGNIRVREGLKVQRTPATKKG